MNPLEKQTTIEQLVAAYQPATSVKNIVQQTPILLLVGISGAGKDTIKRRLIATSKYHNIVTHTTRQPRKNGDVMETDGIEYHFISLSAASNMLKNGEFVEAKEYSGNVYGSSAAEIQWAKDAEKIAVADIEVQGVAEYKAIATEVIAVFILPPNFTEWKRRLQARYGDSQADPADIEKRMQTAIKELEDGLSKPYYHFVINDDLEKAVSSIDKIAHNGNEFNQNDDTVRAQAEQLLSDLTQHIQHS